MENKRIRKLSKRKEKYLTKTTEDYNEYKENIERYNEY